MEERMFELQHKLLSKKYNAITMFVFKLGFISDIDKALKALNIKRTPVKGINVKELEVIEVGNEIDLEVSYDRWIQ